MDDDVVRFIEETHATHARLARSDRSRGVEWMGSWQIVACHLSSIGAPRIWARPCRRRAGSGLVYETLWGPFLLGYPSQKEIDRTRAMDRLPPYSSWWGDGWG